MSGKQGRVRVHHAGLGALCLFAVLALGCGSEPTKSSSVTPPHPDAGQEQVQAGAPTVAILDPAEGALVPEAMVSVRLRVQDGAAGTVATLDLDGTSSDVDLSGRDADGTLVVSLTPADGEHVLTLTAQDSLGQTATAATRFTVDAAGPGVEIRSPAQDAILAGTDVMLTLGIHHLAPLKEASITLGDDAPQPLSLDGLTEDGTLEATVSAPAGTQTFKVQIIDTLERTASAQVQLRVDGAAPELDVLAPWDGFAETRRLLRATVTDDLGLSAVRYRVNDGEATEVPLDGATTSLTVARALPLHAGENTLVLTAEDVAGKVTERTLHFRYGSPVSAGGAHSGAVRGGALYTWGRNNMGQLGLSDTTMRTSPVRVPAFGTSTDPVSDVQSIAFNQNDSLAIRADGTVWAFGANDSGKVGQGTTSSAGISLPTQVPGVEHAGLVALGFSHALVLLEDGTVLAWGDNGEGQVGVEGDGTDDDVQPSPVTVAGLPQDVVKVVGGSAHSVALTADGRVFTWGRNSSGNLGQGLEDDARHPTPAAVPGLSDIVDVAAGKDQTLAVHADGTVSAWGLGVSGQLGNGETESVSSPVQVLTKGEDGSSSPLTNVEWVFANGTESFALDRAGGLWGWGANGSGSLGTGEKTPAKVTTAVRAALYQPGPPVVYLNEVAPFAGVGTGALHSIIQAQNGDIYAWGWSFNGSLGVGDAVPNAWAQTTPMLVTFPDAE